jgi:5,6,7,8-tetrahydromethanopterin hydro-lyase
MGRRPRAGPQYQEGRAIPCRWRFPIVAGRPIKKSSWQTGIPTVELLSKLGGRLVRQLAFWQTFSATQDSHTRGESIMSMYVGEALVGDGNEVAHIDLLIGDKAGPVGTAFANALARQSAGHSNLLAVLAPNLAVKPATVLITKVTIKGAKQAVQMFGPAQYAVAKAVADCVEQGIIPKDQTENLVIVCGVFIHWQANDDKKIFEYNYEATKLSIARAMKGEPSASEMLAKKATAKHPFSGV